MEHGTTTIPVVLNEPEAITAGPVGRGFDLGDGPVGFEDDRAFGRVGDDQMGLHLLHPAQHLEQPDAVDHPAGAADPDDDPFLFRVLLLHRHEIGS
jgi:hypothetical protein